MGSATTGSFLSSGLGIIGSGLATAGSTSGVFSGTEFSPCYLAFNLRFISSIFSCCSFILRSSSARILSISSCSAFCLANSAALASSSIRSFSSLSASCRACSSARALALASSSRRSFSNLSAS